VILPLLLAGAAAVPPPPAVEPDIQVIARKLRKIRVSADADDAGKITACRVTVSSGEAALDGHACDATRQCATRGLGSSDAIADCVDQSMIAFASARAAEPIEKPN